MVHAYPSGNYDAAFEAFTKAKSLGHVKAITGLGILIASGKYGKQYPPSVGIAYLGEAVSKGDTKARNFLLFLLFLLLADSSMGRRLAYFN